MAGMRVVGGQARGRRLKMVPGDSTRPIPDRVKQALFNILGEDVGEARFLDLFAGTGAVGIEALSRGAARVVFLDRAPAAVQTIRANLQATGLQAGAEVIQTDAFAWLNRPAGQVFEYVFVAPPQYQALWSKAVEVLDRSEGILAPDAWVIAQIHPREFSSLTLARLRLRDQRKYGSTLLAFYTAEEAIQAGGPIEG
jgi:16S rRNA (guanine(966)-N(2))-methyltransferase RsmD